MIATLFLLLYAYLVPVVFSLPNTALYLPHSISVNSLNSTHPNLQLNLELTYTEPRLPLTISGVSACTAAAISAARLAGLSNKLPRLGYKTIEDDVGVEVWPFDQAYTWGLMAVTVERVRDELRTRGLDGCRWQVRRVEGGFVGQVLGRGHMWPTLKIVGGEEKETAGA